MPRDLGVQRRSKRGPVMVYEDPGPRELGRREKRGEEGNWCGGGEGEGKGCTPLWDDVIGGGL